MIVRLSGRPAIPDLTIRVEVSGRSFEAPLPPRPVRVGSGQDADLRLEVPGIASTQCVLQRLADGRVVVKDANSGIPTRVNGIEIQQVSLRPGDVLEVGEARVVLREVAAEQPERSSAQAPAQAPASAPGPRPANGRATSPDPAPREKPSGHRLLGPMLGLAAAAALALGLALVLGSGDEGEEASQKRRLDYALDLYRDKDYASARDVLVGLADSTRSPEQTELVELYLERTNQAIRGADAELERFWAQRLDVDLVHVAALREVFLQKHGPSLATRFDEQVHKIQKAQEKWVAARVDESRAKAEPLLRGEQFHAARAVWTELKKDAHLGADPRPAADTALADIETKADASATALLDGAKAIALEKGPQAGLGHVRARLRNYQGTGAYTRLSAAIETLEAEIRAAAAATTAPTEPTPTHPTPDAPTADAEARAAAEKALAAAAEKADAWHFADALAIVDEALVKAPKRSYARDVLGDRREDLDLAQSGVQALARAVTDHPEQFRRIEMGPKFYVGLVRADELTVTGQVTGGTTEYRWATLPPARIVAIVSRAKASGRDALGIAALLREIGAVDAAEPYVFAAGEGGVETGELFELLARWRDEAVPDGGYVAHDGRWVTPKQRDRLVLLAKITDAVRRLGQRDPKVWKPAAEELLELGVPAREPLISALKARRGGVLDDLAALKVFSSNRTKQKLFDEMKKRRAHALVLIRDGRAWPYPNPSGQNTDEVVARVDAVRQVWERPFDVIVGWSKEAKERLGVVSEVDEFLVRADPTFEPTLDDLRDRVNRAVDMPTYTPDSKSKSVREYSLKVLAFNVKVPTTATREEKECVLAVNEYRMMMGHWAVKINERLVRAARGHSHHMRENDYFAHNVPASKSPTGNNRTPGDRARTQGYGGGVGENIARGTWTGRDAFWAWFKSSGHHRNMINAGWTEMGAGRSGGNWWTQLFGRSSGKSLDVGSPLPDPEAFFAPEPEDELGRPRDPGAPQLPDEPPVIPPDWPDENGEPGGEPE